MGALHAGHLSLIRAARAECDFVVVSIFVNPTQFGPGADYASYPRTEETDLAACESLDVAAVFAPPVEEMYPRPGLTTVSVDSLGDGLCGASREGHFDGVCTVVAKLLNIVGPDKAWFGMKDFQQAAIIKRMVADLNIPVTIELCPTVRESDGLALSSRNARLDEQSRSQAPAIYQALQAGSDILSKRKGSPADALTKARLIIETAAPLGKIDYLVAVDPNTLQDASATSSEILLAAAVEFPNARLIDNILVKRR